MRSSHLHTARLVSDNGLYYGLTRNLNNRGISFIVYVSTDGNDDTGNGSYLFPYATIGKGISVAKPLATSSQAVMVAVAPGEYNESVALPPNVFVVGLLPSALAFVEILGNVTLDLPAWVALGIGANAYAGLTDMWVGGNMTVDFSSLDPTFSGSFGYDGNASILLGNLTVIGNSTGNIAINMVDATIGGNATITAATLISQRGILLTAVLLLS
jgi:hypothetical protein